MKKTRVLSLLALIVGVITYAWIAAASDADEIEQLHSQSNPTEKFGTPEVSSTKAIDRPISGTLVIPDIAEGYEKAYQEFLKIKLVYRPNPKSDEGKIELPIAALRNPLEDTFDLSECGDAGRHFYFATGCRPGIIPGNERKVEIRITPWFFAKRKLHTTAENHHLREITTEENWNGAVAPVGIIWTHGGWSDLSYCDYLATCSLNGVCSGNLSEKYKQANLSITWGGWTKVDMSQFTFELGLS